MASASTTPGDLPVIPSEQLTKLKEYAVASGGYGRVFQCTMRSPAAPEALVAVKVLMHLSDEASKLKRARREMVLWMEAKHDNIVPMLGITDGFSDEGFAMVSPWIGGGTLARYLKDHVGTIHSRKKLTLLKDTVKGLAYLHSRHIVHGDLTTNNIMLDDNGKAMLIDFGLSHVLEGIDGSCLTPSPARPGAARFAAPELFGADEAIGQSTGENSPVHQSPMPNVCSDIYSLGCVMLNVFTEQLPWSQYYGMTFLQNLVRHPIPIPAHSHISEERKKLICKCTSFLANERPSCQYVVDVIDEELHVEDALEQSMLEASGRDDLPKLDTETPNQVATTSIQQLSTDLCSQIHSYGDDVTPATIHSESSYSTCLTSLPDDLHDVASSRDWNAPTATQRPNLGVPVLTDDVPTTSKVPNNNSPPVLINSPSRECNIVVAGTIGSGKSSLVNLLSGEHVAQTSINAERCTREWMGYGTSFCNTKYRVFDTVGFSCSNEKRSENYENQQIGEIYERRSIDILLLCMPIRNFHVQTVLDVHKRIQDQFHGRHVPVVLVFNHFGEQSTIDRWWSSNSSKLQPQLNSIANHVCIISTDDKCLDESRKHIFQIIAQHRASDAGEPWQQAPASGDDHSAPPSRNLLGDVALAHRIKKISAQVGGAVASGLGLRPRPF